MIAGIGDKAVNQMPRFQEDISRLKNMKDKAEALQLASREFESLFLAQLLKGMRQSVLGEDTGGTLGGGGLGAGMFQGLFEMEIARKASHRQSLGLAAMVYRSLSRLLPEGSGEETDNAGAVTARPLPERAPAERKTAAIIAAAAPQAEDPAGPIHKQLRPFASIIDEAAETYQVDKDLIKAVIIQESSARPDSVSSRGAKGLMQLMDSTARDLGVDDPFDPEANIKGGTRYLRRLLDRFRGEEKLALASYNAGPGRVERFGGVPPFPETQAYVDRVLTIRQELKGDKADS